MQVYKKTIIIFLIYSYLIISYFKILGLNTLLLVYSIVGILYTIYKGWNIKENINSFDYLWKNDKKFFL